MMTTTEMLEPKQMDQSESGCIRIDSCFVLAIDRPVFALYTVNRRSRAMSMTAGQS